MHLTRAPVGQRHVDDEGQALDVDAARRDVRADQEPHVAVLEGLPNSALAVQCHNCVMASSHAANAGCYECNKKTPVTLKSGQTRQHQGAEDQIIVYKFCTASAARRSCMLRAPASTQQE